jgi:hypothetical protein
MEPDAVLEMVSRSVSHARNLCGDVEWSAEDATRTERDFLRRCVEAAIRAGATTINIPDTVGYTYPSEYEAVFRDLIENVPGADGVIFSTHCHNDLGLAVANSLAGVQGGARQVEVAINGMGERAGNAALEEVVMALKVRGDRLLFETASRPSTSPAPAGMSRPSPVFRSSTTRPSSARTPLPTRAASTRTACSRTPRPTRSCVRRMWGRGAPTWSWASTRVAMPSARS